ncbi:hypothetical protein RND81_02G102300 [Saponaria officinalis]|uniref:DNA replication ATP-dependent helicase/nuclease n=2 Tax=Saponaria officinalis TaxID=3572 RepID=A0AAW1MNY9_SAPOF
MPPKKKSNSKKPSQINPSQPPTKYGIQHFFERATQNPIKSSKPDPETKKVRVVGNGSGSDVGNPRNGKPDPGTEMGTADNSRIGFDCPSGRIDPVVNGSGLGLGGNGAPEQGPGIEKGDLGNPRNGSDCRELKKQKLIVNGSDSNVGGKRSNGVRNGAAGQQPVDENRSGLGGGDCGVSGKVRVSSKKLGLNPRNGLNSGSQDTPPDHMLVDLTNSDDVAEVSPDVLKGGPRKRFKFSPSMIIKLSQDEGGDEVTWKISPVNERLQALSKLAPDVVKALADASRLNSCSFQQLSDDNSLNGSRGNVDDANPAPSSDAHEKSLSLSSGNANGRGDDATNSGSTSTQSPFRTPPSLSYTLDKPTGSSKHKIGLRQCTGLRQHKKALLELLDEVENAISVDGSPSVGPQIQSSDVCDRTIAEKSTNDNGALNEVPKGQTEVEVGSSDPCFLVLEVTEKRMASSSTGAQCSVKVLRVLSEQSGEEHCVHLWDDWFYSVIEPGDTVRVIGEFDSHGNYDVNHEKNLLIVHPNLLLSGTRVAGSFSCSRRAVLDERLKCSEHSTAALIGTLLHQIYQAGLIMEHPTIERLLEFSKVVLQKNIESLYACGVQEKNVQETLNEAIPKICNWIGLFMNSQKSNAPAVDFGPNDGLAKVSISDVVDIEEMAWAPKYGLKGMIDASVQVKIFSNGKHIDEKMMPLEFKTGKATSGQTMMEHSAQLILYTLLMSERYSQSIDSGLLYYLSTDLTKGTNVRRSDLIGIIMRRNELAHDIIKASMTQQLPPMLKTLNMCKSCRHLNACTTYHKMHGGSAESSGLGDLFHSLTDHLTTSHKLFFKHWDHLIDLEAKELQLSNNVMWRSPVSRNESASSCLSSIVLDGSDEHQMKTSTKDERFLYRFIHKDNPFPDERMKNQDSENGPASSENDLQCSLRSGDRVILGTESNCLAVASGIITDISRSHVSVSLSRHLRLPRSSRSSMLQDLRNEVWRIDKDEISTSFGTMRFNLVQLFLQNPQSERLRKQVVDLEAPRFDSGSILSQDPAISYIWSERNLNADQQRAIIKILTAKDYTLILGMPGTGKTSTMVYAVKALMMRGASVLLTSYTNSAVDNLLIKLKAQGIDFVRVGRREAVHKEIESHCLSEMDIHSVEDIKQKLDQVQVVAVTCLGITSPLLAKKRFDVCIIDEAGQTSLPVSLGPLMFSSMFVLVGDHYQLPPLVKSPEARESGMSVSLFRRLSEAHPQAISALQSQYRMCAGIMKLSNALIYGDRLRCGSPDIENAKLKLFKRGPISPWLEKVLDEDKSVVFINTDELPALETKDQKTVNNPVEAHIVAEVTEALVNRGVEREEIGIITPYNTQANLIRQVLDLTVVEVHTIDKYQGRDKDCILVSFVRSSQNPRNCSSSLLGDWHRINVALTRAKKKMIMVGSCKTLSRVPLIKLLIEKVAEQSGIFCITRKDIEHKTELKRCSRLY